MANPYLPPEIHPKADFPQAPRVTSVERASSFWLPLTIAIAIVIVLGYYYFAHTTTMGPSMRAANAHSATRDSN
jgi:hypothetical protein